MTTAQASPPDPFSLSVVPEGEQVAVVPAGDLDLASVDELEREVRELRRLGVDRLVIDLRRVQFLDSSGLRLLLGLGDDARRDGHHLTLLPGPPEVELIFTLTQTRPLFDWGAV